MSVTSQCLRDPVGGASGAGILMKPRRLVKTLFTAVALETTTNLKRKKNAKEGVWLR